MHAYSSIMPFGYIIEHQSHRYRSIEISIRFCYKMFLHYYRTAIHPIRRKIKIKAVVQSFRHPIRFQIASNSFCLKLVRFYERLPNTSTNDVIVIGMTSQRVLNDVILNDVILTGMTSKRGLNDV